MHTSHLLQKMTLQLYGTFLCITGLLNRQNTRTSHNPLNMKSVNNCTLFISYPPHTPLLIITTMPMDSKWCWKTKRKAQFGFRAFSNPIPKLWYTLRRTIRKADFSLALRRCLKIHLFSEWLTCFALHAFFPPLYYSLYGLLWFPLFLSTEHSR